MSPQGQTYVGSFLNGLVGLLDADGSTTSSTTFADAGPVFSESGHQAAPDSNGNSGAITADGLKGRNDCFLTDPGIGGGVLARLGSTGRSTLQGAIELTRSAVSSRPITAGRAFSKLPLAATAGVAKAAVRCDRAILAA